MQKINADEIRKTVKSNNLILLYGEDYMKRHKRAHMRTPCANKMREITRLLNEINRRIETPMKLEDILRSIYFELVCSCTRTKCGYNAEKKTFSTPSLADHMGQNLKTLCDLYMALLMKGNSSVRLYNEEEKQKVLKDVKQFRQLVERTWNQEIGSIARKDLHEKQWKKPLILPFTEDIRKFREYCLTVAQKSVENLKVNKYDTDSFRDLTDALICSVILFNRKRTGDVQYVCQGILY